MKVVRPPLQQLLEKSLEAGIARGVDAAQLKTLLEGTGASAAEIHTFLAEVADRFTNAPSGLSRADVERLLATDAAPAETKRLHQLRADRQQPWWASVPQDAVGAPLYPEPARDVDVHGERFTKDDVADLLRRVGR